MPSVISAGTGFLSGFGLVPYITNSTSSFPNAPNITTIAEYVGVELLPPTTASGANGTAGLTTIPATYAMFDSTTPTYGYFASGGWQMNGQQARMEWGQGLWSNAASQCPGGCYLGSAFPGTYTKFYMGFVMTWVSTTSGGGTGWELTYGSAGIKGLGYVPVGSPTSSAGGLYTTFIDQYNNGGNGGITAGPWDFFMKAQIGNTLFYSLGPGSSSGVAANTVTAYPPQVPIGTQFTIELLWTLDTLNGSNNSNSDGQFQCWVNNVKTHDYRNVEYRTQYNTAGFSYWYGQLYWGGGSTEAKTRNDYQDFAHILIKAQ